MQATCGKHPEYRGLTKRAKCDGCAGVYAQAGETRAKVKDLRARLTKGRAKLKSLGPAFKVGSPDHWRAFLFSSAGLGLKPTGFTGKRNAPSVDDEAIEKLARRHSDVVVLRDRIASAKLARKLAVELAVEPDARGRVHFVYSLHRTNTGRLASGGDDVDADKVRVSPGNAQNKRDADRALYSAPPGYVCVEADWSQIEARVVAWRANDRELLALWDAGGDIYDKIACDLYGCAPGKSREARVMFQGNEVSARDAGKRAHLAMCYYMQPKTLAHTYDIELAEAARLHAAWSRARHAIVRWQSAQIAAAAGFDGLRNAFGRALRFPKQRGARGWEVADPAAAVAAVPQSDVGDMCKVALARLDALPLGELVSTTHDSFGFYVREGDDVKWFIAGIRGELEREWPEFGLRGGKPFRVPVEVKMGSNFAKWHETRNPSGLRKVEV